MKYYAKEFKTVNGYPIENARGVEITADSIVEAIETFGAYCRKGYSVDMDILTDTETGKTYRIS